MATNSVVTRSTGVKVPVEYFNLALMEGGKCFLQNKLETYSEAVIAFATTPNSSKYEVELHVFYYDNGEPLTGKLRHKLIMKK